MGIHICSASEDHTTIWQLAEDLRELGYPIVDRVRAGDVTVLAVSDNTLNSRDCFDQVQHARTHGRQVVYVLVRPLAADASWSTPMDMIDYTQRTPDALIALSSAMATATSRPQRSRPKVLLWGVAIAALVIGAGLAAIVLSDRGTPVLDMAQKFVDSVNADDVTALSTVVCAEDKKFLHNIRTHLTPDDSDRVELRAVNNDSFTVMAAHGVETIPIVSESGRLVSCGYHRKPGLDANGFVAEGWGK